MNATTTPEPTFDGRAVITREPAYVTEMFGKPVKNPKPIKGINHLLLADETTVYECADNDYIHPDVHNVIRHRGKHTSTSRKYSAETLAKVMEYWHAERAVSIRGVNERTAKRLNAEGIRTTSGVKWYASTVSALAQAHKAEYPAAEAPADPILDLISEAPAPAPAKVPGPRPVPGHSWRAPAPADAVAAGMAAEQIKSLVEWIVSCVVAAESRCDHEDYEELKERAAWADRMQSLLAERK